MDQQFRRLHAIHVVFVSLLLGLWQRGDIMDEGHSRVHIAHLMAAQKPRVLERGSDRTCPSKGVLSDEFPTARPCLLFSMPHTMPSYYESINKLRHWFVPSTHSLITSQCVPSSPVGLSWTQKILGIQHSSNYVR